MRLILGVLLLISLGGCSNYSSEFNCKAGKGIGCKSISQVNELINQGNLGSEVENNKTEPSKVEFNYQSNGEYITRKVTRIPERTARVWINSFTDKQGDFVDETYVYTVLSPGKWEEVR